MKPTAQYFAALIIYAELSQTWKEWKKFTYILFAHPYNAPEPYALLED